MRVLTKMICQKVSGGRGDSDDVDWEHLEDMIGDVVLHVQANTVNLNFIVNNFNGIEYVDNMGMLMTPDEAEV